MSFVGQLLLTTLLVLTFSQFGSRLQARNAGAWWLMAIFIQLAAIDPEFFRPVTNALHIETISNFVLAALSMFLFLQLYEQNTETTSLNRRFRQLVSKMAVEDYLAKNTRQSQDQSVLSALVVLPCYNEASSLPHVLRDLNAMVDSCDDLRIRYCVVNDGSMDESEQILSEACSESYVSHRSNIGVAAVLMTGTQLANRLGVDFMVQCDSDGQHPIAEIPRLVRKARDLGADLLIGSRFAHSSSEGVKGDTNADYASTTSMRIIGIVAIRRLLRLFGAAAAVSDPTSGLRVYSKKACKILLKSMPDDYPEPESIALMALGRAKVYEERVRMLPRSAGSSSLQGVRSIRYMIKVSSALVGLRLRSLLG